MPKLCTFNSDINPIRRRVKAYIIKKTFCHFPYRFEVGNALSHKLQVRERHWLVSYGTLTTDK